MIFVFYSAVDTTSMGGVASTSVPHNLASNTFYHGFWGLLCVKYRFRSSAPKYVHLPASTVSVTYLFHPVSPVPFPQFPGCFVTGASSMVSVNYMLALAWDTRMLKFHFQRLIVRLTDTSQVVLILIMIPGIRACLSIPASPN